MTDQPPLVLVVDDDPGSLHATVFLLRAAGLQAQGHGSAAVFLESFVPTVDAALVTDIRMPDMDGVELVRRVRAAGFRNRVVIMTGHGDVQASEDARQAGADAFLEKPFAVSELLAAIRGG